MASHNTKQKGNDAEEFACRYLQDKGLSIIKRNYTCALGEIDLIMKDKDEVVFIEVRSRHNNLLNPIESIDFYKQKKLIKASLSFLKKMKWSDKVYCRFDVIGIHNAQLEWIKNAFTTDNF